MTNRDRGTNRLETVVRDALASASGRQDRAVVKTKRPEPARQANLRHAPLGRMRAPMRSMVMRR